MPYRSIDVGRPLAISVAPKPGEGLSDLILRACNENGFVRTFEVATLFGRAQTSGNVTPWAITANPPDLQLVANVLCRPISEISRMAYERQGATVRFFDSFIRRGHLGHSRRVAPSSLKIRPYQKAIWHIGALSFDPSTMEKLLGVCPVCCRTLGYGRTLGVCFCENCVHPEDSHVGVTDLRDFPQARVNVGDIEALRFVTNFIDPEISNCGMKGVHPDLHTFGRGKLFELAVEVGRLLDQENRPPEGARPHKLGQISPLSLSVAGRALMNWPKGFHEVGERLRHKWCFRRKSGGHLWHPVRQLIQVPYFGTEMAVVVANALKGSLATSISIQLASNGSGLGSVVNDKINYLNKIAKCKGPIYDEACVTGLPVPSLLSCYLSSYFLCPDEHFTALRGRETAIIELFERFPLSEKASGHILLRDAVQIFFHAKGDPWPQILKALRDDDMRVVRVGSHVPLIQQLYLDDLHSWEVFLKRLKPLENGLLTKLTVEEGSFYMNCGSRITSTAMAAGLIERNLTLAEIYKFRRRYISMKEIGLQRLLAGSKFNYKSETDKLNGCGIKPLVGGVGFRYREEVESYYNTRIPPNPELEKEGISALRNAVWQRLGIKITFRQAQVARLLLDGYTFREIAGPVGRTAQSLRTRRGRLYKNMGVSSMEELSVLLSQEVERN